MKIRDWMHLLWNNVEEFVYNFGWPCILLLGSGGLVYFGCIIEGLTHQRENATKIESVRPTTFLLPRDPAVILLVSPLDDEEITTETLAGLHKAGLLAYRAAVEERLELIAKGEKR